MAEHCCNFVTAWKRTNFVNPNNYTKKVIIYDVSQSQFTEEFIGSKLSITRLAVYPLCMYNIYTVAKDKLTFGTTSTKGLTKTTHNHFIIKTAFSLKVFVLANLRQAFWKGKHYLHGMNLYWHYHYNEGRVHKSVNLIHLH